LFSQEERDTDAGTKTAITNLVEKNVVRKGKKGKKGKGGRLRTIKKKCNQVTILIEGVERKN